MNERVHSGGVGGIGWKEWVKMGAELGVNVGVVEDQRCRCRFGIAHKILGLSISK